MQKAHRKNGRIMLTMYPKISKPFTEFIPKKVKNLHGITKNHLKSKSSIRYNLTKFFDKSIYFTASFGKPRFL